MKAIYLVLLYFSFSLTLGFLSQEAKADSQNYEESDNGKVVNLLELSKNQSFQIQIKLYRYDNSMGLIANDEVVYTLNIPGPSSYSAGWTSSVLTTAGNKLALQKYKCLGKNAVITGVVGENDGEFIINPETLELSCK